ncbi:MAG: hypothetical protein U1F43_25530 [Myxococcota bacterium]
MARRIAFNASVAARTRAAAAIKDSPELLAAYQARGGLAADLAVIVQRGEEAEAANLAQTASGADGAAATVDVLRSFAALQREYKDVMAVVQAVRDDLDDAGADPQTLAAIDAILADETAVLVKTVKADGGAARKKVQKARSQEAVRAEIHKDAAALLALTALAQPLADRRVTSERLTLLRDGAQGLAGALADRSIKKASKKSATTAETDAVQAQRKKWGACYRILARLDDERVKALLKDARRD